MLFGKKKTKKIDGIQVSMAQQGNGFTLSISPSAQKEIRAIYAAAQPIPYIFVGKSVKESDQAFWKRIYQFLLPVLLGLDALADVGLLGEIRIVDTDKDELICTLNFSHLLETDEDTNTKD